MKALGAYRTPTPPDHEAYDERSTHVERGTTPSPLAHDNDAEPKVVLYGPRGEALIRQEPRKVGFRKP